MAKVIPDIKLNHSNDTLLTLPKSGKLIILEKDFPPARLAQLDDYLTNHTINTSTGGVIPNYGCYHSLYSWVPQQLYKKKPGKHMGIWVTSDIISWTH